MRNNRGGNGVNLVQPSSKQYGLDYAGWIVKWSQWFLSLPREIHPALDTTGEKCSLNQKDPNVWFLAGTLGGFAERNIEVPFGKAIFCPVLNWIGTLADEPGLLTEQDLITTAKNEMDIINRLDTIVDGIKVQDLKMYRFQSSVFDVILPLGNIFGATPGLTRGVSDGYWLFLRPLDFGNHEVQSFGSCLNGKVQIGVINHLTVKRPSSSFHGTVSA